MKRKRSRGRPPSSEKLEAISTTIPEAMKAWLFDHGGPAAALRELIGEAMKAEKAP